MINNKYKLIALILACAALLLFLLGIILLGSTVGEVSNETVKITSDLKEIEIGWDYQLEVSKTIDANHSLEYSSSNNEVLSISNTGYIKALQPGEVTITVSVKENKKVKDSITVNVIGQQKTLTISEKSIYILPNEERKIYVYNTNPEGYLVWETGDEYVATVENGVIKGVNYGSTEIKVINEEQVSATIVVKVLSKDDEQAIELQDIYMYEKKVDLDVGEKVQLTVIFDPRDVTDKSLVWSSSNPDAITVSDDGTITALADGNSTISAKAYNGLVAKCETHATTNIIPATSVTLNNNDIKMFVGDAYTLKATVKPDNATSKNITWSSSDNNIASIKNGVIYANKEGTVTITAKTHNGKSATAKVTVSKKIVEPYSIKIDKTKPTINIGGKITLYATITPSNAQNKTVTWSSSDNKIATVNNGTVTGVSAGTATITAKTYNGKTATSTVVVSKDAVDIKSLSLNNTNISINISGTHQLKATYTPENATNSTITWSSSNTGVATVSSTGLVRGVKGGTAKITAKTSNGITATCTVEVKKADDVITVTYKTASYTGNPISATVNAKSRNIKSITYYTNSNCTIKTNSSNADSKGVPIESGTYYVIVETAGNGTYNATTSPCTQALSINKRKAKITCTSKDYSGKPQVIATCSGGTISNATQTNVGTYQIACRGTGAYDDATPTSCEIRKKSIKLATVSGLSDITYTGNAIVQTPTVKITIDGETKTLVNGTDYTYTTNNNTNVGTANVVITGKGNYKDSKTATFKILKEQAIITCENKTYNGSQQTIATCNGGTAINANQTKANSYQITCSPNSSHSAPPATTCKIDPYRFTSLIVENLTSKQYTGSPIEPTSFVVKVNINNTTKSLTKGTDYTYTVNNNTNVGNANVVITGKGNYTGTYTAKFSITPAPAVITCKDNIVYTGSQQLIATCSCSSTGCTLVGAYQKNVGDYQVNCNANNDPNHSNATAKTCHISRANNVPKITKKTATYSGLEIKANVSSTMSDSCASCSVVYYLNSSCSSKTNTSSTTGGASYSGGPPRNKGTYYVIVKTPGVTTNNTLPYSNYNSQTSSCTEAITIN